jgi:Late competence development protein ComFB
MKLETRNRPRQAVAPRIYQNVMESLVEKEIERQFHALPHIAKHLDPIDVATYALNRLPPLYASTEKGKGYQELTGQGQLKPVIEKTVRQAIAAVQRDPLRQLPPLTAKTEGDRAKMKEAFDRLQEWLYSHHLLDLDPVTSENLVGVVRTALRRVLKPHLTALEHLQALLLSKYGISVHEDITYENLAMVIEEAIAHPSIGKRPS